MRRDLATWYSYLVLAFFTYLLTIQGNILPFLKQELDLSYRAVSLHSGRSPPGMSCTGPEPALPTAVFDEIPIPE